MPQWLWGGNYVDSQRNRIKSRVFTKLRYPVDPEEVKPLETANIVGTLDTIYCLDSFLKELQPIPEATSSIPHPILWASRTGDISVPMSRELQSLWLDVGPVACCVAEDQRSLPPAASSYSDLRSLMAENRET